MTERAAASPRADAAPRRTLAVTGAGGRLGRALGAALDGSPWRVVAWKRQDYDLDDPRAAERQMATARPDVVLHAAAWTDVDGCARDPALAQRRNGAATGELARACAANGTRLVLISTNEVFDGTRTDGRGYREDDPRQPINAYGASKLAGEDEAREAFERAGAQEALLVVRTAWLYGPPGNDFPTKIVAASDRLDARLPLPVVEDEVGSPTYTRDLALALAEVLATDLAGTLHLVNAGQASRLDAARVVLERTRPGRELTPISRASFARASEPPAWAVLETRRAALAGIRLRPWREALAEYADGLWADPVRSRNHSGPRHTAG